MTWEEFYPVVRSNPSWSDPRRRSTDRRRSSSSSRAGSTRAGTFTIEYTAVILSGTILETSKGSAPPEPLGLGSYYRQPRVVHRTQCVGTSECLVYIHEDGEFSFTQPPKGKPFHPGAPPAASASKKSASCQACAGFLSDHLADHPRGGRRQMANDNLSARPMTSPEVLSSSTSTCTTSSTAARFSTARAGSRGRRQRGGPSRGAEPAVRRGPAGGEGRPAHQGRLRGIPIAQGNGKGAAIWCCAAAARGRRSSCRRSWSCTRTAD